VAAYLWVEIDVTDPAAYEVYRREVPPLIARQGGRYVIRGGAAELLEGEGEPARLVLLEFPSMAALRAFWDDPAYQPLKALRQGCSTARLIAVEGAAPAS